MNKVVRTLGIVLIVLSALPATAQITAGGIGQVDATNTAFHTFVEPGESTINVYVMGAVGSPGMYRIGQDTDLSQLLALMGGNGLGARQKNEIRDVSVKLLRREGGERISVYQGGWDETVQSPGKHPGLEDGDVLMVDAVIDERDRFTWRDGLRVVTSLGGVALLIDRLSRVF